MQYRCKRVNAKWGLPLLFLLLFTPFSAKIDLWFAAQFFQGPAAEHAFLRVPWARWAYHYAIFPAILLSATALFFLVRSYIRPRFQIDRRAPLLLLFTLLLGAGIISNSLLKEYWGRPRPVQTEDFGGTHRFLPFYQPNFFHGADKLRSFPSGHSTMGFFFFSLYVAGRRQGKQGVAATGLVAALILGALLGAARVSTGGHYFSDVVIAGCLMWYTTLVGEWIIYDRAKQYASSEALS